MSEQNKSQWEKNAERQKDDDRRRRDKEEWKAFQEAENARRKRDSYYSRQEAEATLNILEALLALCCSATKLIIKSFTKPKEIQEIIDNALDNIPIIGWLNGWIEQFNQDIKKSEDAFKKFGSNYWIRWYLLSSVNAIMMSIYRCGVIWLFLVFWSWFFSYSVGTIIPEGVITISSSGKDLFIVLGEKVGFLAQIFIKYVPINVALIWWLAMGPPAVRQNQLINLVIKTLPFLIKTLVDITYWTIWLFVYPLIALVLSLLLAGTGILINSLISTAFTNQDGFVFVLEKFVDNFSSIIAFVGETIYLRFPPSHIRRGMTCLTIAKILAGLLFLQQPQLASLIDTLEMPFLISLMRGWLIAQILWLFIADTFVRKAILWCFHQGTSIGRSSRSE
ncbi:hypothetical protein [Okeania sp.]|uniref:hypothetical protein n=1 Tax=Okeania sp. TaxID=3100323 RepID=UPI002B4AF822|nr:hypothetical protein [Okeania sp.]